MGSSAPAEPAPRRHRPGRPIGVSELRLLLLSHVAPLQLNVGRNGLLVSALEDPDADDALFDLAGLTISANMARGGQLVKEKRNTYLEFCIAVQLSAD